ncbi:Acetolactate synthase large subunit or other thiamine pyrophosphate-requiring enzyme [Chelatococcus sambhunathii]|uniref:Acetolactate synthase large subunit or other thiamine pyrophosphate-requiring enzyme n=1 Tax=Chelatococcus sambhunathii TaxID=363953 RepID=A0ABP2A2M7_9HYPH|nr:thiamine pyrophosphate-requiring protein [Chelatococcus sambhunathii]CUA87687.1 Acetolactate synthase large subunit or other thiamine pyrophosphate-requiring enzyme [Chelatococcus sambhunathii]
MDTMTAGGAIFTRLKALGVDYVFANSGTDFPPVIEGLAEAAAKEIALPRALVIPHEHAAMGMAHGYYLMSGCSQAVMLHTNVGLSNGATGAINAACEHVPILLMSGRTPVTEEKRFGARTMPIAWGQEMRDQTALVREACKWDYELKFPEQVGGLLDRAWAIANSTPKGPVYLSLPRETLCEATPRAGLEGPPSLSPVAVAPDAAALAEAARLLAGAERPLVIAQRGAGDAASFTAFGCWAEAWGIAVCSWWATHLAISTEHPCHIGADPGPWLAEADVVLVLDCLAPWWPDRHALRPDARVIHMGPDPLFSRFPVRNFRCDVAVAGESAVTVPALIDAMAGLPRDEAAIAARRARLAEGSEATRRAAREKAADVRRGITKAYVSLCLGEALDGLEASVFSELGTQLGTLKRSEYRSWFQEPHSGGLGWSFPCALGAQLAEPDRICVATMGDGSYMFANPTVCHQIAEALALPVLVIVLNNEEWGAVRASVAGLYPGGHAARANEMPLTALKPSPDFTQTAAASRAWSRRVTDPAEVPAAIAAALTVVREERRQALLDIRVLPD